MLFPAMRALAPIFEAAHSAMWLGRQFSWIAVCAHLHPFRATRFETASYSDLCQIGRLAIDDRKSRTAASYVHYVPLGKTHQRLGVGMKRFAKYIFRLPLFNNSAGIHHHNSIGKPWENCWIMADHQESGAMLLTNFTEQGNNFHLKSSVKFARRLVGDHNHWMTRPGLCHPDALPLTSAQLVRVSRVALPRRAQTNRSKQILHGPPPVGSAPSALHPDHSP